MKQKDIYMILIPSFVVVVFWIGLTIYHNSVSSTIPPALNVQIKPIDPNFDTKVITELKKREKIIPLFEASEPEASSPAVPIIPTIQPATGGGFLLR
jgi:hypothetical protein